MNSLISRNSPKLDISKVDKRLIYDMPVSTRITIAWGTDNCDIDLHIVEPTGEECSYRNKLTWQGGRVSNDFTRGFGPEEYMIKKYLKGTYIIKINYFGSRVQKPIMPTHVYVDVFTDYATKKQKHERSVVKLERVDGKIEIGKVKIGE